MPLSATIEDIKAYQAQVEKGKITSDGLPPCPRCQMEPLFFKIHAYRERRFLLIIEMFVKSIFCTLVRFRCVHCGKTFTQYPDFAMPNKHYTRQTIENFSKNYLKDDQKTYETAAMTHDGVPSYPDSGRRLSGSTIYRWISTLAQLVTLTCHSSFAKTSYKTTGLKFHNNQDVAIVKQKHRTHGRMLNLLMCRYFFTLNSV